MTQHQLTLEDLMRLPVARRFINRLIPKDYDQFIETLYDDLHEVMQFLELSGDKRKRDGEDRITLDLCEFLSRYSGYKTGHDKYAGGHVDITVEHVTHNHRWIAEAKIFSSLGDMREGFLQLTTRYICSYPQNKAGLLAYLRRPNAVKHMSDWRDEMKNMSLDDLGFTDCVRKPKLQFISSHKHVASGLPLEVWHMCIPFYHAPQDRSGRKKN